MRELPGDIDSHGVVPEEESNEGVLDDVAWIILCSCINNVRMSEIKTLIWREKSLSNLT